MNLSGIDLNLLTAFDALIAERNVSRAAARIGLTQPAMSNALARLRSLFGDELFIRLHHEMRPTPRALELAAPVSEALRMLASAFETPRQFDAASSARRFTIGAADNCDFAIAPALARIRSAAPNVDLSIVALSKSAFVAKLDEAEIDLAIGHFRKQFTRFASLALYQECFVCIHDSSSHAGLDSLSIESLAALPHLHVTHADTEFIDRALEAKGLARRIALEVPNFAVVPYAIEGTDLIAVVGERIARRFSALPWIAVADLPVEHQPWTVNAVWSSGVNLDSANIWLRHELQRACQSLIDGRMWPQ